eukprot:360395-Chlamydomonas_euryale.AAC.2
MRLAGAATAARRILQPRSSIAAAVLQLLLLRMGGALLRAHRRRRRRRIRRPARSQARARRADGLGPSGRPCPLASCTRVWRGGRRRAGAPLSNRPACDIYRPPAPTTVRPPSRRESAHWQRLHARAPPGRQACTLWQHRPCEADRPKPRRVRRETPAGAEAGLEANWLAPWVAAHV